MVVELRRLTPSDLDFALSQVRREGWSTGHAALGACLAHDPDGAFVASVEDHPVGMVTTVAYREVGFIGNLIVEPEHRSRGIGRRLMERGLEHLSAIGISTVRLDGDPPGIPLYRSLGFVDEYESLRYRHTVSSVVTDGAEPLAPLDLSAVFDLDREAFGDDRSRLLRLLFDRASAAAWTRCEGRPTAYGLALDMGEVVRIGPVVAVDMDSALEVMRSLISAHHGRSVTLGVPQTNAEAPRLMNRLGFSATAPSLRMRCGPSAGASRSELIYAIAGGAIG